MLHVRDDIRMGPLKRFSDLDDRLVKITNRSRRRRQRPNKKAARSLLAEIACRIERGVLDTGSL